MVLVLPDNIDRATQKGFKVCFQTDYQEKLRGHFYIDIYIAAFVVLVSCLPLFSFLISFFKRLLPLQGARWIALIPRVLPWARSFCPFRACEIKVLFTFLLFYFFTFKLRILIYLSPVFPGEEDARTLTVVEESCLRNSVVISKLVPSLAEIHFFMAAGGVSRTEAGNSSP